MAELIDRRPEPDTPGVYSELWEEDGKVFRRYVDTTRGQRMDWRRECRKVNPAIRRDAEALYGVGYLAPHERDELESKYPRLGDPDPVASQRAWKEFWESSRSEPYRVVDRV